MGSADYSVYVVTLLFLGVSCAFQIVGMATPAWIVMTIEEKGDNWYFGVGLWKVYYCIGYKCKLAPLLGSSGLLKGNLKAEEGYIEQQVETVVAVILLGLSTIFAFIQCLVRDSGGKVYYQPRVTGSFALISGLVALIAVGRMTAAILITKERLASINSELISIEASQQVALEFKFPYSLLLTGIGGLLACITGIVVIVKARRQATLTVREVHDQQVDMEPVSGMWANDRERLSRSYY